MSGSVNKCWCSCLYKLVGKFQVEYIKRVQVTSYYGRRWHTDTVKGADGKESRKELVSCFGVWWSACCVRLYWCEWVSGAPSPQSLYLTCFLSLHISDIIK